MADPIAIGALLTQGLRSDFGLAYQPSYAGVVAELGDVLWLDATSDKLQEVYGFLESSIYPVRWDPGNVIGAKSILSQQFTVTNRDFGRRVYLPRNWDDDQTGTAFQIARELGSRWGSLPERIAYQYMQAGTDNDLLPAVPNSADGSALHISTTRYGSSSGNIVSQTGSSTVQDILTDLYSSVRRYREFQDTESQPYWDVADTRNISVFYGTSLTLVMEQTELQTRIHGRVAGTSTTDVSGSAAVTNIGQEGSINWRYIGSQRITNSRLYLFLRGIPNYKKAVFRQVRKGVTEAQGNYSTSDHTRDTGEPYLQFDSREGWGSALALSAIRIS